MAQHNLAGKGVYIYNLHVVKGAKSKELVKELVKELKDAGITHVYVKIADGRTSFPSKKVAIDHNEAVIDEAHAQGLFVWGWHYVYGTFPEKEVEIAVHRAATLAVDGYIYNAEKEYRDHKRVDEAKRFLKLLRESMPSMPFGFSSFKYPSKQPGLPWKEFIAAADVLMPQVYWVERHDPAKQLERSAKEWSDIKQKANDASGSTEKIVVVPTGSAYSDDLKKWRPTATDLKAFYEAAVAAGNVAADVWSWDFVKKKDSKDLLKAVTDFTWP